MTDEINRIVILEDNVTANLHKCNICKVNFTAKPPCIMCSMRLEHEKETGHKLTKEEYDDLFGFLK